MLQPLDVVVSLKLVAINRKVPGYEFIAGELGLAVSSAYRSVQRLQYAGLVTESRKPVCSAILELAVHAARLVFPVRPGPLTLGIPTAQAAWPLSALVVSDGAPPPVWPDPAGSTRGYAVKPLHGSVPMAVRRDDRLYELLALVDAMRLGHVRDRSLAGEELRKRLTL